jgi:hypothetical protein
MRCRLLRVGPVSRLQDLHPMPPVHPLWRNVNSAVGRFSRFGRRWRLKLLEDDDLRSIEPNHRNKARAVETPWKGAFPVCRRSPEFSGPAERLSRTKSKIR